MNRIFVDLEMHPVAKVYNAQFAVLKTETIEIGAVMLDEDLREISSFKEYVRPDFSDKVYPKYQKLTGITTEMLADADCFVSVFERFCKWCGNNYIIYSWSDNDIWQFIGECQLKGIKYSKEVRYMFNNWKDFQAEFGDIHDGPRFQLGEVKQSYSETVEEGRVMEQTPAPNRQFPDGTKIDLVISNY